MYQSLTSIKRILCLHVPRFAAVAAQAGEREPRALIEQQRQMMIVHCPNRTAEQAGVQAGMALSDARAFAPGLKTADLDPAVVAAGVERLALWLGRYSPLVGHDPMGDPLKTGGGIGFWIDISGVAHLFGGERRLMDDLVKRLDRMGLVDAQMAIAPTPGAAWAATHYSGLSQSAIAARDLRSALYPLAPAALRLGDKTLEALDRLGLRRISDIIRLPREELGQRFPRGVEGLLLRLDQALGDSGESIEPLHPPSPYACRRLYPEPVQYKDAVLGGLREGLDVVVKAMERDQRGARQVDLRLFRVDGHCMVVSVKTNAPSRDTRGLIRLFDDRLDSLDVGFGLDALVVDISRHDALAYEQTSLLSASAQSQRHGGVFDRIANRLGEHAVRQLRAVPSHTPGADACPTPLGQGVENGDDASWQRTYRDRLLVGLDQDAPMVDQGRVAVRKGKLLDPARAEPIAKRLQGDCPRPVHLFNRPEPVPLMRMGKSRAAMTWRRMDHRLVNMQGPERVTSDWWRAHVASDADAQRPRDYYRAHDEEGRGYYLYEALSADHTPTGEWHMAGLM